MITYNRGKIKRKRGKSGRELTFAQLIDEDGAKCLMKSFALLINEDNRFLSVKFALRASEVTPCSAVKYCGFAPFPKTRQARFGDPEGCRKVKLSVPHIVATPHITGTPKTRFTRFGEPLSRAKRASRPKDTSRSALAEHLVEKPRLREAFLTVAVNLDAL